MKPYSSRYLAFLLRLWRENENDSWRIMLEDVHTKARCGFANLDALHACLSQMTGEMSDTYLLSKGEQPMSSTILQINFTFQGSRSDYEQAVTPLAEPIAAFPGLQWKVWLINEADQEAGGLLCFRDQPALHAFLHSPLAAQITNYPALHNFSIKQFDVMVAQTEKTHGPIK